MRRVFLWIILLSICLTGCGQTAQEDPLAEIPATRAEILLEAGTTLSWNALSLWNYFYWDTLPLMDGQDGQIDLDAYGLAGATLRHKDGVYTLTDAGGSRRYGALTPEEDARVSENGIRTTFVLSVPEDPDIPTRQPLFTVTTPCTAAAQFGDVPQAILNQAQNFGRQRLLFRASSYFLLTGILPVSSSQDGLNIWHRYDYAGNLLCEFSTHSIISNLMELEDGGFLLEDETENVTYLTRYAADGSVLWKTQVGEDLYTVELLSLAGDYYLFCQYDPKEGCSDIRLYRIGAEGSILRQAQYGGSDFDFIDYVTVSPDGFTLFGRTHGSDGDFPFSLEGYGVNFTAEITADLTLEKAKKDNTARGWEHDLLGTCQGVPVYSGDPVLGAAKEDLLPEDWHADGIFDFAGGYVIVRQHKLAPWCFEHPLTSYQPSYWEAVVTGYDADGTPLWQITSDVYVA